MKVIKTAQGRGISDDALVKIVYQLAAYANDIPPFDTFAFGGNEFDHRSWSKCSSVSGVNDLARMAFPEKIELSFRNRTANLVMFERIAKNGTRMRTVPTMMWRNAASAAIVYMKIFFLSKIGSAQWTIGK